ncbi:MAG TPA: acyl-CoA synthetase [Acidimicrobiales bacterium]
MPTSQEGSVSQEACTPSQEGAAPPSAAAWRRHLGPAADGFGVADLVAGGSLPRVWAERWAAEPGRRVLWAAEAGGWVTAGELEERTRRRAGQLAALGVGPGDRVLSCLPSSLELVEWHVGALRLGAVAVPANPAYRERELAHVVADAEPAAVLVPDAERATWAAPAHPGATVVGPDTPRPDPADVPLDRAGPDAPALLPYTSGTTGAPKGALLTHANLLAGVRALVAAWRWSPDDVLVLALPLFHMHGLGVGLHGTLTAGAAAVLQPSFDAAAVLDAVAEHRATLFFGVPTMYARLVAADGAVALGVLRLCVSGSAPLPSDLHRRVEEVSGQRVLERYGMTETLMNLSNPYDGERRPGTVGLPLPGVEVRLSEGDHGEIELRGPNVFAGYWRRPEATAEAFTADGWFRTGDLAEVDADGYHRIVGRSKELIISGGYNVYPREVEEALAELPGVREAAVVGTPSPEWGEVVTAFVVREPGPAGGGGDGPVDAAAIERWCAERLAPYKRPRLIRFVESLPRNALGKVLRDQLR